METDEEEAIRYRYHAEEVRALAVLGRDRNVRAALLVIAAHYETMAADLDEPEQKSG